MFYVAHKSASKSGQPLKAQTGKYIGEAAEKRQGCINKISAVRDAAMELQL